MKPVGLVAIEAEMAAGRLELLTEEQRLQQAQEELYVLDNEVKLGEAENEHARKEESRLLAQAQKLRAEQEALLDRAAQAAEQVQRVSAELTELQSSDLAKDDRAAEAEVQLRSLKEQLGQLTRVSDHTKSEIARQNARTGGSSAAGRSTSGSAITVTFASAPGPRTSGSSSPANRRVPLANTAASSPRRSAARVSSYTLGMCARGDVRR